MTNKRIEVLKQLLTEIETTIPFKDEQNLSVSKSTVGWQLDHALKVFIKVSEWTANSNPKDYKWRFNFWRSVLFPLGYFPRGKGKAPKYVLPPEIITTQDLNNQLKIAQNHINILNGLPNGVYFKHFIFGMLTKKQTLRFIEMHTKHHLKIVRDILKK
jgi:hypothetical protein